MYTVRSFVMGHGPFVVGNVAGWQTARTIAVLELSETENRMASPRTRSERIGKHDSTRSRTDGTVSTRGEG